MKEETPEKDVQYDLIVSGKKGFGELMRLLYYTNYKEVHRMIPPSWEGFLQKSIEGMESSVNQRFAPRETILVVSDSEDVIREIFRSETERILHLYDACSMNLNNSHVDIHIGISCLYI
eukprot:GHVR01145506.1.p1 GENE.GHVR01145506.1~~GHVR01145506.1.p1  ORF type:complete len:119 (+),score=14.92 GHVR01145506.1:693-1049(+)